MGGIATRIGFVGTGAFAKQHAASLKRLGAEITACCGTNPEKTAAFGSEFGARVCLDPGELISTDLLDALYLVVPPFALDGKVERLAVERGIPFLCEKPVALELSFCREVASAVEKRGLVTSSGYLFRSSEVPGKIEPLLSRNRIVHVLCSRMEALHGQAWRQKMAKSGGIMLDCGTHTVDFLRRLFGEIESVSATTAHGICSQKYPDCDMYDLMQSRMVFNSGMSADFTICCFLNKGMPGKSTFEFFGENLLFSLALDKIRYKEGASEWVEVPVALVDMDRHNRNFLAGVSSKDPGVVAGSYSDAVKTLAVTVAMNQSAAMDGERVDVS